MVILAVCVDETKQMQMHKDALPRGLECTLNEIFAIDVFIYLDLLAFVIVVFVCVHACAHTHI